MDVEWVQGDGGCRVVMMVVGVGWVKRLGERVSGGKWRRGNSSYHQHYHHYHHQHQQHRRDVPEERKVQDDDDDDNNDDDNDNDDLIDHRNTKIIITIM